MTAGVEGVEPNSGETKQKWGGYQGYFVTDPDGLAAQLWKEGQNSDE